MVLNFIAQAKDQSGVLAILFLLFTVYMGFSKIGLIPPLYTDEFPQSYYKLVNQAEIGKEKPVNGKYRHEEFKEMYDKLVSRHLGSEKSEKKVILLKDFQTLCLKNSNSPPFNKSF